MLNSSHVATTGVWFLEREIVAGERGRWLGGWGEILGGGIARLCVVAGSAMLRRKGRGPAPPPPHAPPRPGALDPPGANTTEMTPVPRRWTANRKMRIATVMPMMAGWLMALVATFWVEGAKSGWGLGLRGLGVSGRGVDFKRSGHAGWAHTRARRVGGGAGRRGSGTTDNRRALCRVAGLELCAGRRGGGGPHAVVDAQRALVARRGGGAAAAAPQRHQGLTP